MTGSFTLGSLLAFAATTGIITALLNQAFGILRDWRVAVGKKKSLAGYHALRLAAILESFAYSCASFIMDNGNAQQGSDEQYPDWNAMLPDLAPYPEESEGWHAIDLKLAGRALDLRNHITGSQGVIASTIEFTMDDLEHTLDEHAAERGLEAWALAVELRRRYGLPTFEPIWDFTPTLETAKRRAQETRHEQIRNAEALVRAGETAAKRLADATPADRA